jgi:phosphoribosyl 1,2-cyclic phosphodiesterase
VSFFVRFWGIRGSIPTPGQPTRKYGGNTSCVEIRIGDQLFICDGGTGLRELGEDLNHRGISPIVGHMFFSHTHWDHIQGFPFFSPAYKAENHFHIWGTKGEGDRIHRLLSGQMRTEYFPVAFGELSAGITSETLAQEGTDINGVMVRFMEQTHPGGSLAFSFEKEGKKVIYATDHELDGRITNKEESEASPDVMRNLPEDFVNFCRGADLLIADAQYTDAEYLEKVGWGHSRALTTVDLAVQAEVSTLALFHHDPMQSDRLVDLKVDECRRRAKRLAPKLTVFGAREGIELLIG